MKRREFSLGLSATAAGLALPVGLAQAQTAGQDYLVLKKPAPVEAKPPKIEIVEFFSYGCPHCKNFEPLFEAWTKKAPQDVVVRREHVGFSKAFEPLQRLYYALESMGKVDALHTKAFEALQKDRIRLDQEETAADWVAKQGVDRAKFLQAYKSFNTATRIKRVAQLQEAYAVEGTPALGIAGKYYTDGSMAKGFEGMLRVADATLAKERKA